MKKIYDKLFLVIAVLFLSMGVYLCIKNIGLAPALPTSVEIEVMDNPYQYEAIPTAEPQQANWPEPVAQSAGPEWIYDVFTPPEIYIDQAGNFVPTGWKPTPPPPPFGVYLSDIVRKPYRIQLEGYIEEDRTDPSKSLLFLFDEEGQKQVRLRPGNESVASEFKVISFDITRLRDADGNIQKEAKASILDSRTGKEVILTHGQRLFQEDVTVIVRSDEIADFKTELTKAPSTFESASAKYTLLEINLEESTVLVEKHLTEFEPAESRTLEVRSATPAQSISPISAPKKEGQDEEGFDFMF
jgi:hypothetical protein